MINIANVRLQQNCSKRNTTGSHLQALGIIGVNAEAHGVGAGAGAGAGRGSTAGRGASCSSPDRGKKQG